MFTLITLTRLFYGQALYSVKVNVLVFTLRERLIAIQIVKHGSIVMFQPGGQRENEEADDVMTSGVISVRAVNSGVSEICFSLVLNRDCR